MMDRRTFARLITAAMAAVPTAALAQQRDKVWRVGFFYFGSRQSSLTTGRYSAFVQAMSALGYVEGKNLLIETRFGDGRSEAMPALVAELVQSRVDVIVATGSPVYSALRRANTTIPIVVTVTADAVKAGLADSWSAESTVG